MLQRFYGQLPEFARPDFPLMRYALLRGNRGNGRTAILRSILALLLLVILIVGGYQLTTSASPLTLDVPNALDKIFLVLYWPLVLIQIVARVYAIGSTSGVISAEVQH